MDVELQHVRVDRGDRCVLDIPALRLRGERITTILGPNGAGKTTLLRLIAGLERPRTGDVRVGGSPARTGQQAAYVFQEQVFVRGSVRDNLELGLRLRAFDKKETRIRVEQAASLLGITHLMGTRADRLSGGEGRRVSLARALCLKAPLVLLDEPLSGLDERTYSRLLDELPQILAAFNATTLLVTHSRQEALRLSEDLVILVDGKVRAAGAKREVAINPGAADVAEVLGYSVLSVDGRKVAVPPGALKPGAGPLEFQMHVDDVLDLVDSQEIVGRVEDVCVRVEWPAAGGHPQPGDRVLVHAERSCLLERR